MTFDSWHVPDHLYFITASTCGWKPLFSESGYTEIILNSLAWLRKEKRMALCAFVLMPTHLHTISKPLDRSIGDLLQNFGSFMAHEILRKFRNDNRGDLIEFFHQERRDNRQEHSIWQDVQAKNIFSARFLAQKLEYIHQNPVSKEWKLVEDRSAYEYSSACFYDEDRPPVIEIDDIRELL